MSRRYIASPTPPKLSEYKMNYPIGITEFADYSNRTFCREELANGRWTILPTDRFAIHYGWTDYNPFEIIRVISDRTIEIREMKATLDANWKPIFEVGGFGGHCTNSREQKWNIFSDESQPIFRIRRSNKRGRPWRDKHGLQYALSNKPRKYYDYNF